MKLIFCILCLFGTLSAEIIPIDSVLQAVPCLETLDKNDLVLFDVDFTLIVPDDAIFRPAGLKLMSISKTLSDPAFVPPGKYPPKYLHSQIIKKVKMSLIEEDYLLVIRRLQQRKVPTIALTYMTSGSMGAIESMADFRINELKNLRVDFSEAFSGITLLELPTKKEAPPLYKSGVLFSSKHPKGDVLRLFLNAINWRPKKVVFFDDSLAFLESVESALKQMSIDFVGYHYSGAEKLPCHLDKELAEFQFRYLGKYGEWLSDQEARAAYLSSSFL